MREALLEGHDLAFRRPVVSLRVEGDHASALQASIHVLEEDGIGARLAVDGDIAGDALDERPLDSPRGEDRCVAEKVNPGLRGEGRENGKRIEPVQVVGDQHVVAVRRNVLATVDLDSEQHVKEWNERQLEEAKHRRCLTLDREQVSRRDAGTRFHGWVYVTVSSQSGNGRQIRRPWRPVRYPLRSTS